MLDYSYIHMEYDLQYTSESALAMMRACDSIGWVLRDTARIFNNSEYFYWLQSHHDA